MSICGRRFVLVIIKPVSWPWLKEKKKHWWKNAKHKQRWHNTCTESLCLFEPQTRCPQPDSSREAFFFSIFRVPLSTLFGAVSVIVNKQRYTTTSNSNSSTRALAQLDRRFSLSFGVRGKSCAFTVPSAQRHLIFRFKWHFSIFTVDYNIYLQSG